MRPSCRAWLATIERLPATLGFVQFKLGAFGISLAVGCWSLVERQRNEIKGMKTAVGAVGINDQENFNDGPP